MDSVMSADGGNAARIFGLELPLISSCISNNVYV